MILTEICVFLRDLGHPSGEVRVHGRFKKYVAKYSSFQDLGRSHMLAAGQGIEPRFTVPETVVLPLDDPAMNRFLFSTLHFSSGGTILPEFDKDSSILPNRPGAQIIGNLSIKLKLGHMSIRHA